MAEQLYTESFIRTERSGALVVYEVPEDRRAVLTCVTVCNAGAGAAAAYVRLHGILLLGFIAPVSSLTVYNELRIVAYERETMDVWLNSPGMSCTMTGYSFRDTGPGDPPPVEVLRIARPKYGVPELDEAA